LTVEEDTTIVAADPIPLDVEALEPYQEVFDRFVVCEFTTIGRFGQPITWPVTPYLRTGRPEIEVTTGLGYPQKAHNAAADPRVSLLFSDPLGSGISDPPMILVQGLAEVDDSDLEANRRRYARESLAKLPATEALEPPDFLRRFFSWYYTRIYIRIRPLRMVVWPGGGSRESPEVVGTLPKLSASAPTAALPSKPHLVDPQRLADLGVEYSTAAVSWIGEDRWPASVRVAFRVDAAAKRIWFGETSGPDYRPDALACLTVHGHAPDMTWQRNMQVRGRLRREGTDWSISTERLVGGFEIPPGGVIRRSIVNARKATRFRRIAKRELARRQDRSAPSPQSAMTNSETVR